MSFFARPFSAKAGTYKINPFNPVFFLTYITAQIKGGIFITFFFCLVSPLQGSFFRKFKKFSQTISRKYGIKEFNIQIIPAGIQSLFLKIRSEVSSRRIRSIKLNHRWCNRNYIHILLYNQLRKGNKARQEEHAQNTGKRNNQAGISFVMIKENSKSRNCSCARTH